MAVSQLAQRMARTSMAELDAADDDDRLRRIERAWRAYDHQCDDEGHDEDEIVLDYAALIVDKGASFLAGKGGVKFQIDLPSQAEELQQQLAAAQERLAQAEAAKAAADQALEEPIPPAEPPTPPEPRIVPKPGEPEPLPPPPSPEELQAQAEAEAQQQQQDADTELRQAQEQVQELQSALALQALDDAWPEEQRALDFHQLAVNGGVTGHFWLRLYDDGRVSVVDPANVTVEWTEDDYTVVERMLLTWNTFDRDSQEDVLRRKRMEPDDPEKPSSWTITDEEWDPDAGVWRELEGDPVPWEHSFAPLLGGQNLPLPNTYYGKADLEPAIVDMIEQLQSAVSDMRRILRLHGHPVPVVFGASAEQLATLGMAIGELLAIPDPNGKLGQLQIAELTSMLAFYQELKTALFESAHVPKVALGDTTNAGPVTGVALQVEYEPMVERTETKRLTYGLVLRQAAEAVLELVGMPGHRVTLAWPPLLPSDEQSEATTFETDQRMGIVSKQTVAEKRGYDWNVEEPRLAEQQRQQDQSQAEALAQSLGNALHPGNEKPLFGG